MEILVNSFHMDIYSRFYIFFNRYLIEYFLFSTDMDMDDSTINEYIEKSLAKNPVPNKKEDSSEIVKKPKNLWLTSIFNFKFIFIIILIVLWVYRIKDGFFEEDDKLFVEKKINEVKVDNKMVPVSNVKVVKISEWVYDSMEWDEWSKYLLWSSKKVMFIYWDGCRYARAYNNQIKNTLEDKMFSYNYEKEIIKVLTKKYKKIRTIVKNLNDKITNVRIILAQFLCNLLWRKYKRILVLGLWNL